MTRAGAGEQDRVIDAVGIVRERLAALDALARPGHGRTRSRWRFLADLARHDLSVARLAEGHVDARAILHELGRPDLLTGGQVLGVWAADPGGVTATPTGRGWVLDGVKAWCSGSTDLDAALMTATAPDGPRLFLVATSVVLPRAGSWQPMGMVATRSETLEICGAEIAASRVVGEPGAYVGRPGFGHGGCGVAACWWGGALGVLDGLHRAVESNGADPQALGRAGAALVAAGHTLGVAADAIDARPEALGLATDLAVEVRMVVARAARGVLDEVIPALGASGLCQLPDHSRRVADLLVYLSQHRDAVGADDYGRVLSAAPMGPSW